MSLRLPQTIVPAGTAPTFTAATASDTIGEIDGRVWVEYRSTHSATTTVTVLGKAVLENGDVTPNKVYTLGIGNVTMAEVSIPMYRSYQDSVTGLATITTSQQTAVTMAVRRR